MTSTCDCEELDYHTKMGETDIYLCEGHDNAFYDDKGLKPIICDLCGVNRQKIMIWDEDTIGYVVCDTCDEDFMIRVIEHANRDLTD